MPVEGSIAPATTEDARELNGMFHAWKVWSARVTMTRLLVRSKAQISFPAPPSANAFQLPLPKSPFETADVAPVVEFTFTTTPVLCCSA